MTCASPDYEFAELCETMNRLAYQAMGFRSKEGKPIESLRMDLDEGSESDYIIAVTVTRAPKKKVTTCQ